MARLQLKWLNLSPTTVKSVPSRKAPARCQSTMVLPYVKDHGLSALECLTYESAHLDTPLTGPEDPSLSFEQAPVIKRHRPPGISTLREWGEMKLPEGKWKGSTFAEAFSKDNKYVQFMTSHTKLVSPWALSFQSYARARVVAQNGFLEMKNKMEVEMEKKIRSMIQAAPWKLSHPSNVDWEVISQAAQSTSPRTTVAMGSLKRAMEEDEKHKMIPEFSMETRKDKMTKMAVMQHRATQRSCRLSEGRNSNSEWDGDWVCQHKSSVSTDWKCSTDHWKEPGKTSVSVENFGQAVRRVPTVASGCPEPGSLCEPDSQITEQCQRLGLRAERFTVHDGDLATSAGRDALWKRIMEKKPKEIWMSPESKHWGNYSRRNMGRSISTANKVLDGREKQRVHLKLCNEVFLHQMEVGGHFHLEQPQGSEAIDQPEVKDITVRKVLYWDH